ncbi:MAG TPA: VanW family protein [Thermoleophilia bacterium]|nr:VanW family protein [Thermoleophilia bacterium]
MTPQSRRSPRRRKNESLPILVIGLLAALIAWPFQRLFGSGRRRRLAIVIAAVVGAIVLAALVDAAASEGKIHAHVSVYGTDVGGLTVEQATERLRTTPLKAGTVTFTWQGRRWTISSKRLRAHLDATAAAQAAYDATRTGNPLGSSWSRAALWVGHRDVRPAVRFSQPAMRTRLDEVSRVVAVRPVQGGVSISGTRPVVRAAKDGRAVDRAAVLRLVGAAAVGGTHVTTALPTVVVKPVVSTAQAQSAADTARTWLSGPLRLTWQGHSWDLSAKELGQFMTFVSSTGDDPEFRATLDSPVTRGWFDYVTARVGRPGKDASFKVSRNGRHVKVKAGAPGYGVVPRKTIANMEAAAAKTGSARVAAAVFGRAPAELSYAEAAAMHITRRIATYTTGVSGTTNRLDNVQLGAQLLDGALIAPGKVFSVNATTGERTAAKGFKMAPTIINGKLEDSIGGGMCQVSTTVFNAAFEAGLQIVERHNHMLYISHYPLGRDATVSYGSYDLKFRNDTPDWILLKTSFSGWALTVSLYGTPLHRKVVSTTSNWYGFRPYTTDRQDDPTLAKGKTKVDTPGVSGQSIDCFRKVYDAGGKLLWNDVFHSVYAMVPEVLLVGTKEKPKPTATPTPTPSGSSSAKPTTTPKPKPSPSKT